MEKFVLVLKDQSKRAFLLELINQLDFVEVKIKQTREKKADEAYDFFQSAGLFTHRDIDANQLRQQAWRIKSK